jgi:hypothetical protein
LMEFAKGVGGRTFVTLAAALARAVGLLID